MLEIEVLDAPSAVQAALDPVRSRILALLAEPGSATSLAKALGLPRQQVNYHLRTLEQHGLVRLVEERRRRGLTERVMAATARRYVVSPAVLGGADAETPPPDRLSAGYLLAVAARLLREVAELARGAERAGRPLATLTIDTEIRFASSAARAAFARELAEAITTLAARHHDETAAGGRWHRLVVAAHPRPPRHPQEVRR
ncbi:MAG: ArsR/SmtB family transcription factor [Acidimicrobiales bacterium]